MDWVETKYPGYFVNTQGELKGPRGKLINGFIWRGYKRFKIQKNHVRIHLLVLETFVPRPNEDMVCDHINRNKLDNRLENLRWVTKTENNLNTDKPFRGNRKLLTTEAIADILTGAESIGAYSRKYAVSTQTIARCIKYQGYQRK